jgi:hypothetical protein
MADKPPRYDSPPESIELALDTMRDISAALTKDALGHFPASHAAMDWDGLNMQPHDTAWQDMDLGQRYDLLRHVLLDESIWSLERGDSQKLAIDFVREDARQAMPGFRADAFDALTTRLEAFADEFARLARTDGQTALAGKFQEFVGEAQWTIARLAEARPSAIADERDGMPTPEEWRKLQAEWTHDYGLRRLEERGASYQDEAERTLDQAAGGDRGDGQENKREVSPADLTESAGQASQNQGRKLTQNRRVSR